MSNRDLESAMVHAAKLQSLLSEFEQEQGTVSDEVNLHCQDHIARCKEHRIVDVKEMCADPGRVPLDWFYTIFAGRSGDRIFRQDGLTADEHHPVYSLWVGATVSGK